MISKFYGLPIAGALLACLAASPAHAQTQNISVVVNRVPVAFTGAPPQEINNSVLVPLRGVFQQLGASVDYNSATQQIQSKKGSITVVLTIGQKTAFVNGAPEILAQSPIVIAGTTLVPLRFVAQSFGAQVKWLPATQTVEIRTPEAHLSTLPTPPANPNGEVVGSLTGVYTNTNPEQITLRVNGQNTSIPINQDTIVLVKNGDGPPVEQPIRQLQPGDQVRVTVNGPGGVASTIRVHYGELTGTVKSITSLPDGSSVITLNDGQSRQIAPDARLSMAGRSIGIKDILPDEFVVLHSDPATKIVYSVNIPAHLDNGPEGQNGNFPRRHHTDFPYNHAQ